MKLSIKQKIQVVIVLTGFSVALISIGIISTDEIDDSKNNTLHHLQTIAGIVSINSAPAIAFNDPFAAEETLDALNAQKLITCAHIHNLSGVVFAQFQKKGNRPESHLFHKANCKRVLARAQASPGDTFEITHWGKNTLDLIRPIYLDGKLLGILALTADLKGSTEELYEELALTGSIIMAFLFFVSSIASRISRNILGPVVELAHAMSYVSKEKDYSVRVPIEGQDELGTLNRGFNKMLSQIEEQNHQLKESRDRLEEQVVERTEDLKKAVDEAHNLAFYDSLTGLPNRILLRDRIEQALARAQRSKKPLALLFLDLDRFKRINDTLGHHMGDLLLKTISCRLKSILRTGDTLSHSDHDEGGCISRLGGDEFVILLPEIQSIQEVAKVAQRSIDAIAQPVKLNKYEVTVTTSIGISTYPDDGNNYDQLLKHADVAMYHSKQLGKNNYQFYKNSLNDASLQRLSLENDLRKALERNEFLLNYQPQLCAQSGRIIGAEALVRWKHPEKGMIAPGEFIPVAEESGLIIPLGEWILRAACEQSRRWQDQGLPPLRLSVNLSGRQFSQPKLVETISAILNETRVDTAYLILELTESMLMENREECTFALKRFKDMGIRIAMDDFGTGYSSMNYLKTFPIDIVKIDRSFVRDITTDPNDATITRTIIAMARNLGLGVVAEGVETVEQFAFLQALNCNEVQGFLFSQPVSAEQLAHLVQTGVTLPSVTAAAQAQGA